MLRDLQEEKELKKKKKYQNSNKGTRNSKQQKSCHTLKPERNLKWWKTETEKVLEGKSVEFGNILQPY